MMRTRNFFMGASAVLVGATLATPAVAGPCGTPTTPDGAPSALYPLPDGADWGYVDRTGTWALAPQWRQVRPFAEGRAAVETAEGWGVIDTTGAWVVRPGARDADGVVVGETAYPLSPYKPFSQGCSAVTPADGTPHYITRDGTRWDPPALEGATVAELGSFSEGLAAVTLGPDASHKRPRTGWIDTDGAWAIAPEFAGGGAFADGVAPASLSPDNHGYIDRTGEIVFPHKFVLADAAPVRNGLARLTLNGETGFWDGALEGNDWAIREITWPEGQTAAIDRAGDFHDGRAAVHPARSLGRLVWIDTEGAVQVDPGASGRLSLCAPERLAPYTNGLLPLIVAKGGNICGKGPDITYQGEDPRLGEHAPLWVVGYPQAKLVWLDRDGAVAIDSAACRADPGHEPLATTRDDGSLAAAAYRLTFSGAATGETAPQRADAPCNRSEYTGQIEGTNAGGPWRISLSGAATWQGHPVDTTLSLSLPADLAPGTHAFGPITDDAAVSANLWMSRPDVGPQAERPPSFASQPGGELVLERRDTEAATGHFTVRLSTLEGEPQTVEVSGRFNALPYTFAPEVQVKDITGVLKIMAEEMDDPFVSLLYPATAKTDGDGLRITLGKWGPSLNFAFPEDHPDGPFEAGPGKPVSIRVGTSPATATGTLRTEDGVASGTFQVRMVETPKEDVPATTVTGAFSHLAIQTEGD
ncbi:WG repeat-containing protein [Roseospira navarrensis]|uniref:WG repeat-containing protein n=1 Tax=Roseospira navarrensis TaxID=140058 RepID=A0A7X1ZD23_9PROT|nr:WG repeat-containing protein [Roseospira navarrensis]MQX36328.1 hypothetical protein [Roseospira navarrensis]